MKKAFRIEWARTAKLDLEAVVDFIAQNSPQNALRVLHKIRGKAETLKHHPLRTRPLPELLHIPGLSYRELVLKPWRLIYQVRDNLVVILAFLDGRRDLEDVLYERLTRVTL